jgi:hypothetical protein
MVDTLALGASAARCEGSSPFPRTTKVNRDVSKARIASFSYFIAYCMLIWSKSFVSSASCFANLMILFY